MKFKGTYSYVLETAGGRQEQKIVLRDGPRAYEGEIMGAFGCEILENVRVRKDTITVEAQVGPQLLELSLTNVDGTVTATAKIYEGDSEKDAKVSNITFEPAKRRALILYATMTQNTEKVAQWFKETFEYYNWEVTMFRMTLKEKDWEGMQEKLYFDDYDVVCLGSPIVAAYPLTVVNKVFSLGAGGQLEANVQSLIDAGQGFVMNEKTMGGGDSVGRMPKKKIGANWRRRTIEIPGAQLRNNYHPLGIVFTTYSGSFFGSEEAMTTLTVLKLFLGQNDVDVIGQYACNGKEFGPGGLEEGQIPMNMKTMKPMPDPVYYETADGKKMQGCYFFHNHAWDKPGPREETTAKAFIANIVEDYFFSWDGKRNNVGSQYISIS